MKLSQLYIPLTVVAIVQISAAGCINSGEKHSPEIDSLTTIESDLNQLNEMQLLNSLDLGNPPVVFPPSIKLRDFSTFNVRQAVYAKAIMMDSISELQRDTLPIPLDRSAQIRSLERNVSIINAELLFRRSQVCRAAPAYQPVQFYDGSLGASPEMVSRLSSKVGQLQWNWAFPEFNTPHDKVGTVPGERWGSGCLIGNDLFLTAAHCFRYEQQSWEMPLKNNLPLNYNQIAKLMHVQFNYEFDRRFTIDSHGVGTIRSDTVNYPVTEVVEYRPDLDYAIVRLGRDSEGNLPGTRFGVLHPANRGEVTRWDPILILQHPSGGCKVVGGGRINILRRPLICYDNINTETGSSGAPVISVTTGKIIGVHINGRCDTYEGENQAIGMEAIRSVSSYLRNR